MHDMMAHAGHGVMEHVGLLSLLGGLFMVGLVGGLTHCTGMCGPFVLAQTTARLEAIPARDMREWKRLTGAALLPYHLGRGCTYAAMGAIGAAIAGSITNTGFFHWLPPVLLVLAAVLLLGAAFPRLIPALWKQRAQTAQQSSPIGRILSVLFKNPVGWRGWVLGLFLGFLPCGFLYGALSAAAASGSAAAGALAMASFTAGTALPLMVTGLIGHVAGSHWRTLATRCAPWLLSANAVILLMMAWKAATA